jgi:hypothetical protein
MATSLRKQKESPRGADQGLRLRLADLNHRRRRPPTEIDPAVIIIIVELAAAHDLAMLRQEEECVLSASRTSTGFTCAKTASRYRYLLCAEATGAEGDSHA